MQKSGNFHGAAVHQSCCPTCGAVTNPRWGKCLSCKSMLSVVTEPAQPDTPSKTIAATPLGQIAKSKLPPATLDAEDWRAFFTERSAVLEHDGGLSREKADRLAYESCVSAMTWVMTSDYPDDRCSACGSHLGASRGLVLADHAVVCNSACHRNHMCQQRERAERQLVDMGITVEGLSLG